MAYKHDYDKILTRLTTILSKLNNGEALSVKTLAEEFGVSTKTLQRDFNERLSGFPIYQEGRKWKMQDGFKIEKNNSSEEQLVLDIIDKMTEGIGGKFASISHKLISKIKNEDFNPIYTKLNIEDISDKLKEVQDLELAIKNRHVIHCVYNNEVDKPMKEILKPLKIVNYEGFWYLVALDEDEYVRKLYLKQVSAIEIKDKLFTSDTKLEEMLENSINIWFQSDRNPFEVKLYADEVAAKYFKRRPLPTQNIVSVNQDGSCEFSVTITYEMEIIPIIKYWIPHLRVLEPSWIQAIVDNDLETYLKG